MVGYLAEAHEVVEYSDTRKDKSRETVRQRNSDSDTAK